MSLKTRQASAVALAAMVGFTMVGAAGSGAFAQALSQDEQTAEAAAEPLAGEGTADDEVGQVRFVSLEVVQPLPDPAGQGELSRATLEAGSLEDLVAAIPTEGELSNDMQCLAGAIYFEARGEPLDGQLAVGRVIVNRAESGRFPASYCGVVYQRAQFSFIRAGRMPAINTASQAWQNAKAIARIAHEGLWDSPAKGALYFHASYVNPRWRLTRVGQVNRHIFYR
jgi:hypothetical protein